MGPGMKGTLKVAGTLVFLACLEVWSSEGLARSGSTYELSDEAIFQNCPFRHNDRFSFDGLVGLVKSQLETKLQGNEACDAIIHQINDNISAIQQSFLQIDEGQRERIAIEIINDKLVDLHLALTLAEPGSAQVLEIQNQISILEADLMFHQIDSTYKKELAKDQKELEAQKQVYSHINSIIVAMRNAPPGCIERLGSWQTLLPSAVGAASLATGYGHFAGQEALSAVLQIVSSVISLFQNRDVKKAISKLVSLENYEILACTYYSIKFTACEYSRAHRLSQDVDHILNLIERSYNTDRCGEYQRYFDHLRRFQRFRGVFDIIAEIGTPLTLNLSLINRYLQALRSEPFSIPSPPIEGTDAEIREWLNSVKRRGITFLEFGQNGPLDLEEQIAQAQEDIRKKIADIEFVEAELAKNPSFIDLRSDLDAKFPDLAEELSELIEYFKAFLGFEGHLNPETNVDQRHWGSLLQTIEILETLEGFLAAEPKAHTMDALEDYESQIKDKGLETFRVMTKHSIAQIDAQTVLLLGGKVRDRIHRSFSIIEQAYLKEDLFNAGRQGCSFSEYRRDQALEWELIQNYESFVGQGLVFRAEKISRAQNAFWDGFQGEIMDMIEMSFQPSSDLAPNLQGETSAHLCSLFADLLERTYRGRRILRKCKENYSELEILRYTDPSEVEIDYENACFYADYSREVQMQKILFERYRDLQRQNKEPVSQFLDRLKRSKLQACVDDLDLSCGLSAFALQPTTSRAFLNGMFSEPQENQVEEAFESRWYFDQEQQEWRERDS